MLISLTEISEKGNCRGKLFISPIVFFAQLNNAKRGARGGTEACNGNKTKNRKSKEVFSGLETSRDSLMITFQ